VSTALSPHEFPQTIRDLFGDEGRDWLARLPATLDACARRWSLTLGPPFEPLSYHYVAPAVRADGTEVVLKLGVPNPLQASEMAALRHFAGRGAVRLLAADANGGAMLLERLRPGTTLVGVDDVAATAIAAEVMAQLWRPPPEEQAFPTVADWGRGFAHLRARFEGGTGPLPAALVARAEALFAELLATSAAPVLLHGDLHHANILAAGSERWLAIDPQGVIGEPAYEVGALLRNPTPQVATWPDLGRISGRRADQLAERLGFERERLLGWGLAEAILSAWWSIEDHGRGWEPAVAVAEALAGLMH
jgi:streptomycin 6-kinase